MIDKDAIKALQQADAIEHAAKAIVEAMNDTGLVALPNDWQTHDLEPHRAFRRRARGTMKTTVLPHFADYVRRNAEAGAAVFVDCDRMAAVGVLNLGTPAAPGHADSLAEYRAQATAPYVAMLEVATGKAMTQRQLAEWVEDWGSHIVRCIVGADEIEPKYLAASVRRVTIEGQRRVDSETAPLSATKSTFERVQASAVAGQLPEYIVFSTQPFVGLESRDFTLRLAVLTDGKEPMFTLRIVRREEHIAAMAVELAAAVEAEVVNSEGSSPPVYVGTYCATR